MKINEIAKISTGYSFRKRLKHLPDGDTRVIQMSDIDPYKGILLDQAIRINFTSRNDHYYLKPSDILLVSKGHNIFAYLVPSEVGKTVAVNSFLILKMKTSVIRPDYLVWFLNSKKTQYYIKQIATGTVTPNLSKKTLQEIEVPVISAKDQKSFAMIDQLKSREVIILHKIAEKKEFMINEMLQNRSDNLQQESQ